MKSIFVYLVLFIAVTLADQRTPGETGKLHGLKASVDTNRNTSFGLAMQETIQVIQQSLNDNSTDVAETVIVFITDGQDTDNYNPASDIQVLKTLGTRVYPFAVGAGSSCTTKLDVLAAETGTGSCSRVERPIDLEGNFTEVFVATRTIDSVTVTVDDVEVPSITQPTIPDTGLLPQDAPASVAATLGLGNGSRRNFRSLQEVIPQEVCLVAHSQGDVAQCCVNITSSSPETPEPTGNEGATPSPGPTCEFDVLYENDFESPNQDLVRTTYGVLDSTFVNVLYGRPDNLFSQTFTVETFFLIDSLYPPANEIYRGDPQPSRRGSFAIGMQGVDNQNDLLALGFDLGGRRFLEISLDVTPIGLYSTGSGKIWPFDSSILKVSLLDDPSGRVPVAGAAELDSQTITAEASVDPWLYNWQQFRVTLDGQGSTNGRISIVWDFENQGYNLFDNVNIRAVDDCNGDGS